MPPPQRDLKVPTFKKPIDATPDGIMGAFNQLIQHINDRMTDIEQHQRDRTGDNAIVEFRNHIAMNNQRVTQVARSQTGTDAVNRDEVQELIRKSQQSQISEGLPGTSIRRIDPSSGTLTETIDAYETLIDYLVSRGIIQDVK